MQTNSTFKIPPEFSPQERALTLQVHEWHFPQMRKSNNAPYVTHLIRVAAIVKSVFQQPILTAAALCHDLFEDTQTEELTLSSKLKEIGYQEKDIPKIIHLVWELTDEFEKKKYPQWNRAKRKAQEVRRLSKVSANAASIKLADLIDNTRDIHTLKRFADTYLREERALLQVLTHGHKELVALANEEYDHAVASLKKRN